MRTVNYFLILIFFLSANNFLIAANQDSVKTESPVTYYLYPYAFYTPETNLALGGGGIGYYKRPDDRITNPSTLFISAYYTINNQFEIIFRPEIYLKNNYLYIKSNMRYGRFIDKFYGIGNETPDYDSSAFLLGDFSADFDFQFNTFGKLNVGFVTEFSAQKILDTKNNRLVKSPSLTGKDGGIISGAGFSIFLDDRDNIYFPLKGNYLDGRILFYKKFIGSDFNFSKVEFDLRKYVSFIPGQVLAANFYFSSTAGEVPFLELSKLGGDARMRGYYLGRFRDKQYYTLQFEYRAFLFWRFRGVIFGSAGQVSGKLNSFSLRGTKFSYGAGLRFILDKKENLDFRLDAGFGENSMGIYLAARQAF